MPIQDFWELTRTEQDPEIPNLPLETPAAVAGDAPFSADWLMLANQPQKRFYAPYASSDGNLLTSTLATAPVTLLSRVPLITQRPAARQQGFVQVAQNLLLTTLAVGAVAAPFVPDEFQNPVRRAAQVQPQVFNNLLTNTLAQAPAAVPFKQTDWQNPRTATTRAQPQQQAVLPGRLLAPFKVGAFTVSVAKPAAQQPPTTPNLSITTLAPAASRPFVQADWQRPTPAKPPQQPDVAPSLLQGALYTDPPTLVARVPLVSAAVKRALAQQPQVQPSLLTTTLATQAPAGTPFKPFDWQNPARRFGSLDAHSIVTTSYYEQSGTPIVPLRFDNPTISKRVQQPDIPRPLLQTTLFTAPAVPLVRQTDWQNPVRARLVQQPQLLPNLLQGTLFTAPAVPVIRQSDWTNPVRPRQVQQPDVPPALLQSSLFTEPPTLVARVPIVAQAVKPATTQQPQQQPSLLTTTLAATGPQPDPFRQTDWPNPARRIDTMGSQAFASVSYYSETPFSQTHWPNPVRPRVAQQPEHQVGALQTYRFVPPQPLPFNKSDWLNPQPIKPVPQLWNTSQGQNPEFIPPPVVVVVPPPVGGDDKPEARRYPGWDKKRSTLKRNEELRLAEDITALYRKLTGNEATAERAKAIVQPVSPAADLALAESRALARRALQAQAQAVEIEIALRLLADELQAMLDEEDELAIAMIIAAL